MIVNHSISKFILSCLVAFCMCGILIANEPTNDWPQWRGPNRDGHAVGEGWPESLTDNHIKLSWRVELEPSYSGPVVVGDRVFTTETAGEKDEVVTAFNRHSGKKLWSTNWPGAMTVPFFAAENGSWIRSTPVCDEDTIYVGGIRDVMVALDQQSGDVKWRLDFPKQIGTPLPSFGFASSPLIHQDALYVQAGGGFVKVDKANGKILWRSTADGGGMMGSAFSSPLITELEGKLFAVVQTRLALKGVDLETGNEYWSQPIEAFRGMNILTPIVYGDHIFTSAHTGRSQLWKVFADTNSAPDKNGLDEVWRNKSQAYMSSPVVVDGYLYMHLRNQRIQCIELATGEEKWRTRPFGKYQSMVVIEKNILALDQRGELLLFRADPSKFDLIDKRKISEDETWAHLAVCGGQLFVRELNALAVYDWK